MAALIQGGAPTAIAVMTGFNLLEAAFNAIGTN
jgi:hypothetical protein